MSESTFKSHREAAARTTSHTHTHTRTHTHTIHTYTYKHRYSWDKDTDVNQLLVSSSTGCHHHCSFTLHTQRAWECVCVCSCVCVCWHRLLAVYSEHLHLMCSEHPSLSHTHTHTHTHTLLCDWQIVFLSSRAAETLWCKRMFSPSLFLPPSLIPCSSSYLSSSFLLLGCMRVCVCVSVCVCASVWVCERLPGAAPSLSLKCYLANQLDVGNSRWALSSIQSMTLILLNQPIKILLSAQNHAHTHTLEMWKCGISSFLCSDRDIQDTCVFITFLEMLRGKKIKSWWSS